MVLQQNEEMVILNLYFLDIIYNSIFPYP
uniref:Uncharacterized protein n=1 Tax=Rhizophora mucronata TaxID=61149 RepID=A0A2P2INJ8_RHIMU